MYDMILDFVASEVSLIITFIASVLSIVLAVFSMIYAYGSNKKTTEVLEEIKKISKKIEKDNKTLVEKIKKEGLKDSFGALNEEDQHPLSPLFPILFPRNMFGFFELFIEVTLVMESTF